MAILDSQGRLFGKINVLDIGAALVILLVIIGIFFFPGTSGTSVAQFSGTKPVEVELLVKGLSVLKPQELFKPGNKANFIIRNQPYGQVDIKAIKFLEETIIVTQPDGSVKVLPNPKADQSYSVDMLMTVEGKGQITKDGPVLGGSKIKVGTPVELDGDRYNFKASVIDVRVMDQPG